MKKILAFAGSTSSTSINKTLIEFAGTLLPQHDYKVIDLRDFEAPLFSVDKEEKNGIPTVITDLAKLIDESELVFMSLAEHNGAYSAAFKNAFDWLSRIKDRKAWGDKDLLLMATSPGARGGSSVLEIANNRFKFNGGNVLDSFSLPSYYDNFEVGKGITNVALLEELKGKLAEIVK